MSIELLSIVLLGTMLLLIALGTPIAFAAGATAVTFGLAMFGPDSMLVVANRVYDLINNYTLVSVPLFIWMGLLLERTGVAEELFAAVERWTRRLPGGLAVGTIFAAAIMAAMVGVIGAEIVALGLTALPAMLRRGYDRRLAFGVVCAGGSLGSLIPPSVVLLLYGVLTNVSIGKLFAGALIPGLLYAGLYTAYVIVRCSLQPRLAPRSDPGEGEATRRSPLIVLGAVALIAVMFGSLYLGVATPSEVAAIGAACALMVAILRRRLTVALLRQTLAESARAIGVVLAVFVGANALVAFYNFSGGISFLERTISGLPLPPLAIVGIMMLIWFLLGFVMDFVAILFLTVPVFAAVIKGLGYDPIWLGVLFCMNMQMSYLTPPFGPAVFYLKGVAPPDATLQELFGGVWPFVTLQALGLALVVFIPELVLWLPSLTD